MLKNTKELIEVMQAFANGQKVEFKSLEGLYWYDLEPGITAWNWEINDYRIKIVPVGIILNLDYTGNRVSKYSTEEDAYLDREGFECIAQRYVIKTD